MSEANKGKRSFLFKEGGRLVLGRPLFFSFLRPSGGNRSSMQPGSRFSLQACRSSIARTDTSRLQTKDFCTRYLPYTMATTCIEVLPPLFCFSGQILHGWRDAVHPNRRLDRSSAFPQGRFFSKPHNCAENRKKDEPLTMVSIRIRAQHLLTEKE